MMKACIQHRAAPYLLFALGLGICTLLWLHRLGRTDIAAWDEIVHVNVVHNLSADCCIPKLHSVDLGTDSEDSGESSLRDEKINWINNYIWFHKPLMPFYFRAALFHLFGESLFLFRLPSVVFAVMTAIALFFIARRLSSLWVAVGIALLFACNKFVFELVQGRQFSDLSDVMILFFMTLVLGLALLTVTGRPLYFSTSDSPKAYWAASLAAALFSALAYSSKGGLALPGLGVFALALLWQCGWRRGTPCIVVMSVFFCALALPGNLYAGHLFPSQFHYEQSQQIAHLFTNVENWGRPWYNYITKYWQDILGPPLGILGFLAIMASFRPSLCNRRNTLLVLWILCYVVPLSFGVSKIANFILPVLPAVILLVGFSAADLLRSERRSFFIPLTATFLLAAPLYFLNSTHPLGALTPLSTSGSHHFLNSIAYFLWQTANEFVLLGIALGVLLIAWLLPRAARVLRLNPPSLSPRLAVALASLLFISIFVKNLSADWKLSNSFPANHEVQMALRSSALKIKAQLPQNAVLIVNEPITLDHPNSHLYFQYWSGINTLPAKQLDFARRTLLSTHPLYLLSKDLQPNTALVTNVPYGYLYQLTK
jgi:4-amino-4-deoxy-L-arabinose transferase-like glycosyltransferase